MATKPSKPNGGNNAFGQQVKADQMTASFLSTPGQDIVTKMLSQMASIAQFVQLFGPYTPGKDQQRWADYQRFDWSVRQLPALNVFEAQVENKGSDNAFLDGTISFQVFWPPNLRRSDLRTVQVCFKGIMQNFFASKFVTDMLDELYYIQRPMKVYGLNKLGNELTWSPNVEGIVENEAVPVTILDVRYRVDLRSWYRALEFMDRTKENPFVATLSDLNKIGGEYDGVLDEAAVTQAQVFDEISVENP